MSFRKTASAATIATFSIFSTAQAQETPGVCRGEPISAGGVSIALEPGLSMPILLIERSFNAAKSNVCDEFIAANGFKVSLDTTNVAAKEPITICFDGATGKADNEVKGVILKNEKNDVVWRSKLPEPDRVMRSYQQFAKVCGLEGA